jgi:hypothetical protein
VDINAADRPFINEKGTYEVTKRDNLYPGTVAVAGTVFQAVGGGQTITAATQPNGIAAFMGLTVGTAYIITEVAPPAGYGWFSTPASLAFTPQAGGRIGSVPPQVHGAGNIGNDRAAAHTFEIKKLGGIDDPLENVTFTLTLNQTGLVSGIGAVETLTRHGFSAAGTKSQISGADGLARFENLPFGSYTLTHPPPTATALIAGP